MENNVKIDNGKLFTIETASIAICLYGKNDISGGN